MVNKESSESENKDEHETYKRQNKLEWTNERTSEQEKRNKKKMKSVTN